jgi:hypothetical protein
LVGGHDLGILPTTSHLAERVVNGWDCVNKGCADAASMESGPIIIPETVHTWSMQTEIAIIDQAVDGSTKRDHV